MKRTQAGGQQQLHVCLQTQGASKEEGEKQRAWCGSGAVRGVGLRRKSRALAQTKVFHATRCWAEGGRSGHCEGV